MRRIQASHSLFCVASYPHNEDLSFFEGKLLSKSFVMILEERLGSGADRLRLSHSILNRQQNVTAIFILKALPTALINSKSLCGLCRERRNHFPTAIFIVKHLVANGVVI